MNPSQVATLDQVRAFLSGASESTFTPAAAEAERYTVITQALRQFAYRRYSRIDKGLLLSYLLQLAGYSRRNLEVRFGCGMAMSHVLAGENPAWVTASHRLSIEACSHVGNSMVDA